MTLSKIETLSEKNPFLRPYEVELSPKVKFVSEIRETETKYDKEKGTKSNLIDIELLTEIKPDQYKTLLPNDEQERKTRIGTKTRTLRLNMTSFNFLFDRFGEKEADWVDQEVEFVTVQQVIEGSLKSVIYAKGSEPQA